MPEVSELFFVRLWYEPDALGKPAWRGSVEHVGRSLKVHFPDIRDISDIIAVRLTSPKTSDDS
ncbi:MAG: hypothetical protein NVSMB31_02740 [Vulcanimicrobiaceae bacterium]